MRRFIGCIIMLGGVVYSVYQAWLVEAHSTIYKAGLMYGGYSSHIDDVIHSQKLIPIGIVVAIIGFIIVIIPKSSPQDPVSDSNDAEDVVC